jgi:hypothetical protein
MAMTPGELEALTFEHLPEDYVRRAVRAVFAAHKIASDEARKGFDEPEAENVRPFIRRAKLEGYLRDAAELVEGVEAKAVRAEGSFWNHTEVRAGLVILTESTVQSPCALVEKAEFRETLARNAQLQFWNDADGVEGKHLYVLLLHSRYQTLDRDDMLQNGHLPGSLYLAYPARDLESYVHSINLLDRYREIVRENVPEEWDQDAVINFLGRARKRDVA